MKFFSILSVVVVGLAFVLASHFLKKRRQAKEASYAQLVQVVNTPLQSYNEEPQYVHYRKAKYRNAYDKMWGNDDSVHFGGNSTNIYIETSGGPPGEKEFILLDRVFAEEAKIHAEIRSALFQEYQRVRDSAVKRMTEDLDAQTAALLLPPIGSKEEMGRISGYSIVEVPIQSDEIFRFRIVMLANWEDDGIQIRYVDGKFQGLEKPDEARKR